MKDVGNRNSYVWHYCEQTNVKMKLERKIIKLSKMKDIVDDEYVDASMADRIEMVWDITQELWSISTKGKINAESRLQRNVTNLRKA